MSDRPPPPDIALRRAGPGDAAVLERIAQQMNARHEPRYFERCLDEQAQDKRAVLLACAGPDAVGYVQLVWQPVYAAFRRLGIPEIQDLNVVPDWRGQGIGSALVTACESMAQAAGKTDVGISVGLCSRYGAAQRLYAQKGYVPDGAGICHDDIPVKSFDIKPIDHNLTLKMIKNIST